jgi:4-carboxymuconolactone decarboxylase
MGHYLRFDTDLTELQRELAICGTVRSVEYAWTHHSGLLKQLGLSDAQLGELKKGEAPKGLSPADSALCKFIFAFSSYKGVPDATLAEARKHFSERQVMDIAFLSSYYIGSGAMIVGFEVPLEPKETLQLELDWQTKRPH